MHRRRMRAGLVLSGLVACLAVLAGVSFACTNLATMNLSTSIGKPGDTVTLTGSGFLASAEEMPMDAMAMDIAPGSAGMMGTTAGLTVRPPVVLRWNGPEGPVLSEAIPDRTGTISVVFDIPQTPSGHYTVFAVQKNLQGFDVYGTPARAPIQVVGAGERAGGGARGGASVGAGGQSSSTGLIALTVGLGVLGLGLLAAGSLAATRAVRARRSVPARVDGRHD